MPSFDSLRGPRRRSPVDVLVPVEQQAPVVTRPPAPRPPVWSDLLPVGLHVAGWVVAVPVRVLRWAVGGPVRRLLGV
jgi:hypothetical protein